MWGVGPSQTCLPVWSNQGALGHMSWTQACGPHPRFQAEPPLTPGCIEVGTSWHFSKKVKMRPTSAKQAVGDRKYDQPEVATEMCRVSESLVPQWPSTGPQGPQASQFFFFFAKKPRKTCRRTAMQQSGESPTCSTPSLHHRARGTRRVLQTSI